MRPEDTPGTLAHLAAETRRLSIDTRMRIAGAKQTALAHRKAAERSAVVIEQSLKVLRADPRIARRSLEAIEQSLKLLRTDQPHVRRSVEAIEQSLERLRVSAADRSRT